MRAKTRYSQILFLTIFTFWGCGDKSGGNLYSLLTSESYWDIYETRSSRSVYTLQFKKDGTCRYLFYDKYGNISGEFDDGDNVVPKKWALQGDTIIYIRGLKRDVVSYNSDTIILLNKVADERELLIRHQK